MKNILYFSILLIILTACMKTEDEIYPIYPIPENVKIGSTGTNDTYQYWTYYDLESNKIVLSINKGIWDLGFACSDTSLQLILNTASFMTCGNSNKTDFSQVTSSAGILMNFDASSGNIDSNAIGKWFSDSAGFVVSNRFVYVVDRGIDVDGNALGLKKFYVSKYENKTITVVFANLNGTNQQIVSIRKDSSKNYIGLSFNDAGSQVNFEPNKDSWDIVLGQYTTMLSDNGTPYPYIVNGGMINPRNVKALELRQGTFADIDASYFTTYTLSTNKDAIGYNWKTYSLSAGKYTITDGVNYLITDRKNKNYKFRFVDFYDDNGNKGYPKFEYQKL